MKQPQIILKKVKVHNLKNVDLTLDHNQLIVFTGVSGSGKSSLAFDTIFIEGQRRYVESLSTYARRHLGDLSKPDAELISGISPTIAIEQKTAGRNPRSTVGTMTGIYDFLRVLYARIGIPHCPVSGEVVAPQSIEQIIRSIKKIPEGSRILLLAPFAKKKKGEFKEDFADLMRKGFTRLRLDGHLIDLSEEIHVDGKVAHDIDIVIDRLIIRSTEENRLAEAITAALENGNGVMTVLQVDEGIETLYSQHAYSAKSGLSYGPLDPVDFSFNHPSGMCPTCQGLGNIQEFDLERIIDPNLSIAQDCCSVASSYQTVRYGNIYDNLARLYDFDVHTPWKKLSEKAKKIFLYGTEKKWTRMQFVHPLKKMRWIEFVQWRGVLHEARERFNQAQSETYRSKMKLLMHESICPSCHGEKIAPYAAATTVNAQRIAEVTAMAIDEAFSFFQDIELTEQEQIIAVELLKEIRERLSFLKGVGLNYLTLDRTAPTLSGGESQRVRLASQIGSGLVGATYVLDEPSIGLHPRDNAKLLATLKRLRDKGNTVIVVEHDEETIRAADTIVDVGPLAGQHGGRIIVTGSFDTLLSSEESLTGAYLSGKLKIPIPKKRRTFDKELIIQGASHHNLKKIDVAIPLGLFVAVTGVSGSGKSSLIIDTLYPALANHLYQATHPVGAYKKIIGLDLVDKVIAIDQTPIGRTPRSNPSTFIKLFDDIRMLFSTLPQSIAQGYKAGRFSFNVKEGSCPHCSGMGLIRIDMDFMEDQWVPCEHCDGKRFDSNTLSILYRGKSIYDILEMTVAECLEFFASIPHIKGKLDTLMKVGLDYIKIGQPSPSLSGGEAQRIKLAKELSRPSTGNTLYILDEPTTGLHFHDIRKLIAVLQELVDKGNTVLVIEHNMDLIKTTDWIIDLGPEGGREGGKLIASATPEKIAKLSTPTGIALKSTLKSHELQKNPLPFLSSKLDAIEIQGAFQNNLKGINARIPRGKITICTGPSGSGKSSFAFETVYAEGQRRYIESLSPYARQFVKQMPKPKVDHVEGLSPAIAIEQKSHAGNPRSTIGTMTETYDYLRLLFAHLGIPHCPETKEEIKSITAEFVAQRLTELEPKTKLHVLSPLVLKRSETFDELKDRLQRQGFLRIRLNNIYYELDQEIPFDKQRKNAIFLVIDRLHIGLDISKRLLTAIEQAAQLSGGTLVADAEGNDLFFNLSFAVPSTGKSYPPITPHTFSFNTEQGMCLDCQGLGFQYGADLSRYPDIMQLNASDLILLLWKEFCTKDTLKIFSLFLKKAGIDARTPLKDLPNEKLHILFQGAKEKDSLSLQGLELRWIGLNNAIASLSKSSNAELRMHIVPLLEQNECPSCRGARLNPLARHVTIDGINIADLCSYSIDDAYAFLEKIKLQQDDHTFLEDPIKQLKTRMQFLQKVGLGYLSLTRSAPTLSGGEAQRIRLARGLGSGLTGCLYVLDEPTIGLHPHDNERLNDALMHLCSLGNTLLLVEHDPLTLTHADYIFDFGPHAGKYGGRIIAQGTLQEIKEDPASLTGAYLSGRKTIPLPSSRKKYTEMFSIRNACLHNLKDIAIDFPIGIITCVTGVSGSGKSTLINDLLRPAMEKTLSQRKKSKHLEFLGAQFSQLDIFDKLLVLDQNPIGQTIRADISTYADLLSPLRHFFASLPEAQKRGLSPKFFSFNHKKGMCTNCFGLGTRSIPLQFLPPVKITCESCHGFRLNPLSLMVTTKGKHLGHILHMSVEEALAFLPPIPKVVRILETLVSVGLGYVQLGQEIATLSGGEAQRLRLVRELSKRTQGSTLYLFDEPTVGLHTEDIVKLLSIFHRLTAKGHTVVIIEHNLDVMASADYIIDMGPGSGAQGGQLVVAGTPEEMCTHPASLTGRYLKPHLEFLKKKSSL